MDDSDQPRLPGNNGLMNGTPGASNQSTTNSSPFKRQINLQRIRDRAKRLQSDLVTQLDNELDELFDTFVSEIEQIESGQAPTDFAEVQKIHKKGTLPDKVFITRRSVLTELFEVSHIRSIYHVFVAILIIFSLNTIVYDIIDQGKLKLDFNIITYAFGKFPKVMYLWVLMQLAIYVIVYPSFYWWSTNRKFGPVYWKDYVWLSSYVVYQMAFLGLPVLYIHENDLPPASSVIIITEQIRLIMKIHSFIRENVPRALAVTKEKMEDSPLESPCPDFSKYLYFLFAPTLIYRDSYPRTPTIRWSYVVTNFAQVLACLFYIYYIFERFCVPVFQNFNQEYVTPKALLLSAFSCMMPGTLVLLIGFFAVLHSWLNAFAEMLRFGDRLFYKDWWNSTTFSNYYRTWNVVVHDWLYTYIYKDMARVLGARHRALCMSLVFMISAIAHEYIFTMCFGFFYPILFCFFAGAGFGFIFLTEKRVSRSWNVFMWVSLFMGNGFLLCLYSMEWYARQNCKSTSGTFDFIIPRTWTCHVVT